MERDTPLATDLIGERIQLPGGLSGTVRAFSYQGRTPIFTIETNDGTLRTYRGEMGVQVLRTT